MEPMNLGSPPSSPASPNPNFLPAFLMGDSQPTSPSPVVSPGRNKTPILKMQAGLNNQPTSLRQKLFASSINDYTLNNTSYSSPVLEKGGPPKQGLFDTLEPPPPPKQTTPAQPQSMLIINSTMQNFSEQPTFAPNESFSQIGNDSLNYSCTLNESKLAFQNNVSYRSERVESLWITAFGFIPSASSLVLSQLAHCGTIAEKKYPSQGNWIHVKFSNPQEVVKALLLNGKFISNCTMLGVVPYNVKSSTTNKENLESSYTSPIRARALRSPTSPHTPSSLNNVPQKSTGIVTKAMEYVFGW